MNPRLNQRTLILEHSVYDNVVIIPIIDIIALTIDILFCVTLSLCLTTMY